MKYYIQGKINQMYWNIKSETFCDSTISATSFDTMEQAQQHIDDNIPMPGRYEVIEEGVPNVQAIL